MNRWMYRAQIKPGKQKQLQEVCVREQESWKAALIEQGAETCSIFSYGQMLFIYIEASFDSKAWVWPKECQEWLEAWPDAAKGHVYQMLMPNVFYDGTVSEVQKYRHQRETTARLGAVAILKPDMVSSYVFYHYQMQEEKPGSFNQSYSIGLHGEYLFSYHELPVIKGPSRNGKLVTNHTPSNWHDFMAEHFVPWQDSEGMIWLKLETCFAF